MVGVFFATGFEEVEALAPVDLMRRAGIEVKLISINETTEVMGARGVKLVADECISNTDFESLEGIVLPGGAPGFKNLDKSELLMQRVSEFLNTGKLVAAICGAPSVLGKRGMLKGKKATVYPGMEDMLEGASVSKSKVVKDGNLITSRGMGTAVDFGLALVEYFRDENVAKELSKAIVFEA